MSSDAGIPTVSFILSGSGDIPVGRTIKPKYSKESEETKVTMGQRGNQTDLGSLTTFSDEVAANAASRIVEKKLSSKHDEAKHWTFNLERYHIMSIHPFVHVFMDNNCFESRSVSTSRWASEKPIQGRVLGIRLGKEKSKLVSCRRINEDC